MPDDLTAEVIESVVEDVDLDAGDGADLGDGDSHVPGDDTRDVDDSDDPEDPYATYGGKDTIDKAVAIHQALQTEDGVWNLFFQAGRSLGLGVREIEALFAQQQGGGEPEGSPEPDDDDVMTYGQFKAMLNEQVLAPWQQTQQATAEAAARSAIDTTCLELGVKDTQVRDAVLRLGDKYLSDDISPQKVQAAVRRGFADYQTLLKGERQKAVTQKREAGATVPKSPAGAVAGAPAQDAGNEPKDVAEAIRRARARIRANA